MGYNLFGSEVRNRVTQSIYIHSNRYNFQNVLIGQNAVELRRDYIRGTTLYRDIDNLIIKAQNVEKAFYKDIDVESARDFSNKYLLGDTNVENVNQKNAAQKTLWIIQNIDFLNLFKLAYSKADVVKQLEIALDKKFTSDMLGIINDGTVVKEMGAVILDQIRIDFEAAQKNWLINKEGKAPKIKAFQQDWFSKSIGLIKTKHPLKGVLTSKNSPFLKDFIQQNIKPTAGDVSKVVEEIFEGYFRDKAKEIELEGKDLEYYLNRTKTIILDHIKAAGSDIKARIFSDNSNKTGIIGEMGLQITNKEIRVIGDAMVKQTITTKDKKGNDIKRDVRRMGKSDLEITGKSGRIYRFQAKNTLAKQLDPLFTKVKYTSAKFLEGGNLKRIIDELIKADVISSTEAKELMYALLNFEFLSYSNSSLNEEKKKKDGNSRTDKYGNPKPIFRGTPLNQNFADMKTRLFLTQLLANGLLYFIGIQSSKEMPKDFDGNLFIVYANRYLIPFSWFLESIKEGLEDLQKQAMMFVQKPATDIQIERTITPENLLKEKTKIISKPEYANKGGTYYKKYLYPDELLNLGSSVGQEMSERAEIERGIHFNFDISKIEQLFETKVMSGG